MVNRIILNETSYFGPGSRKVIAEEVAKRGYKKALVITDKDLVKFGVAAQVTDVLKAAGIPYEVFDNVKQNPTVRNVKAGIDAFKAAGADFIVAIGGGSSIDTSKAVGIIVNNPEFSDVVSLEGVAPTKKKSVPVIALPTTAGTAAEVTINYVITDEENVKKMVCVDPNDIPTLAVIDPELMLSMPRGLTAATGMDALTHAIEAYIGRSTTRQTRSAAVEAIQLIFDNLQNAYNNGNDKTARHHMLRASYLAGTAFTKSYVGYVHAVAHSLGGCYGIPHGLANSVLLPVILEAYGTAAHKKLARLARLTGISDSDLDAVAAGEFIRHIRNMNLSMNIPETLDGIRNEDIPKLARYADKEANPLYPVPVLWGPSKLEQMYHLVQEVNENDRNRNSEHPGKAA